MVHTVHLSPAYRWLRLRRLTRQLLAGVQIRPPTQFSRFSSLKLAPICSSFGRSLAPPSDKRAVNTLHFSTTNEDTKPQHEALSMLQKVRKVLKEYGTVAVVFHTAISLASFGTCYFLVTHGLDVERVLQYLSINSSAASKGASTAAIAYVLHKVFLPVRATATIVCAPIIVKHLRMRGWIKEAVKHTR